jgi:hypothetical protein
VVQPMAIINCCANYSVTDIMSVSDVMGDYSIGVLSIPEIEVRNRGCGII